jgi:nitrate reductase (NAD(P)H)
MPETARKERAWWYDPRYIITDLNTNSAIAQPGHEEELTYTSNSTQKYPLAGYAYTGGGRRVSRVEITLDGGRSWKLANVNYPEDTYRKQSFTGELWGNIDLTERDECFCWVFWEIEVDVAELDNATSIAVRAMDEGMAVQPSAMYWNATGMMKYVHRSGLSDVC